MYTGQHWQKVCRRGLCTCGHGVDSPGCRCCMARPALLLIALPAPALLLLLDCSLLLQLFFTALPPACGVYSVDLRQIVDDKL